MDNYNKKIKEYLNLYNEGMWDNIKSGAKNIGRSMVASVKHAYDDTKDSIKTGAINMGKNALRVGAHVAAGAFGIPLPNKGFMKMSPLSRDRNADRNEIYKNLLNLLGGNKLNNILNGIKTGIPNIGIDVNKATHYPANYNILSNTTLPGSATDSKNSVYYIDLFDQLDVFETDFLRRRAHRNNYKPISEYKSHPEFIKWLRDKANPPTKG